MRKKKETLISLNLIRIFTLCSLKIRMTWQHVFVVYNLQSEKKFLHEIRSIRMLIGNFIHQICHMSNNLKIMFLRSLFWWLFHIAHTPFIIELLYYANDCKKKKKTGIPFVYLCPYKHSNLFVLCAFLACYSEYSIIVSK